MDIKEINRITELVKTVNCSTWALIPEVAREMGVKKTALMQFIQDNPKLFRVVEARKRAANGRTTSLGLAICFVYLTPEQNPETEEWLAVKRREWEKKLHVDAMNYYNQLEFFHICEDPKDENNRYHLYRNTPEKIKVLTDAGILKKEKCIYGGLSDCYTMETCRVTSELIQKLKDAGWTTDFEEVKESFKQ